MASPNAPSATRGELIWQFCAGIIGGATMPPFNALLAKWALPGWQETLVNLGYYAFFIGIFAVVNRPVYRVRKAQGKPSLKIILSDLAADGGGTFAGYWLMGWAMTHWMGAAA